MALTWLGLIHEIGNVTKFVNRDGKGNGYLFDAKAESNELTITETISGESTVILSMEYDEDGELKDLIYYSTSYQSTDEIEDELDDWLAMLREDGVIADAH